MNELVVINREELEDVIRNVVQEVLQETQAPGELLTTAQLAKRLQVSEDLIRIWVRERGCPCLAVGPRKLRFRYQDVLTWVEEGGA